MTLTRCRAGYSWDQSDSCVTLYIPVEAPTAEETAVTFGERSVCVGAPRP